MNRRNLDHELANPLVIRTNKCIKEVYFPNSGEPAMVNDLYKNSNVDLEGSYRPISVLPDVTAKLLF